MNKLIIDEELTPEQQDTVRAFARAVKQGSKDNIEIRGGSRWVPSLPDRSLSIHDEYRIKPGPSYRPWTPVEAIRYLGATVVAPSEEGHNKQFTILAVREDGVNLGNGNFLSYATLAEKWTLRREDTPCGILNPES